MWVAAWAALGTVPGCSRMFLLSRQTLPTVARTTHMRVFPKHREKCREVLGWKISDFMWNLPCDGPFLPSVRCCMSTMFVSLAHSCRASPCLPDSQRLSVIVFVCCCRPLQLSDCPLQLRFAEFPVPITCAGVLWTSFFKLLKAVRIWHAKLSSSRHQNQFYSVWIPLPKVPGPAVVTQPPAVKAKQC